MARLAIVLAAAGLAATLSAGAIAQQAEQRRTPVPQVDDVRPVEPYRDTRRFRDERREEGTFVLRIFNEQLFLLDTETGCMWSRETRWPFDWKHEFPRGGNGECDRRLSEARTAVGVK
jgi:hypothetical protein